MKVISSTGPGRLHFLESAAAMAGAGAEVNLLTGWVPSERQHSFVNVLGALIGERNLARRLAVRRVQIEGATVTPESWAEAGGVALQVIAKAHLIAPELAVALAFRLSGWRSCRHLSGGDVFLVRSGAGQGGAIRTARSRGLSVVADHSIAHPAFMKDILEPEYRSQGLTCGMVPDAPLWQLVLQDCHDADLVLVNSDFVKDTFVRNGFDAGRIRVVYLGVREDFFGLKTDYQRTGPLKILFTGRFDLRKGARVLLEAMRVVRARGLDASLEVIGQMGSGRCCVKGSDSEFLTLTPFVPQDELKIRMAEFDLFAFPTLAEGSSRSGMEALAAGLPVVTTTNCGLPAAHGITALYVPAGSVEALAASIENLADSQTTREDLGRSAAELIARSYTWDHYGRNVVNLFEELKKQSACASASLLPAY